jgi:hypothetical protein
VQVIRQRGWILTARCYATTTWLPALSLRGILGIDPSSTCGGVAVAASLTRRGTRLRGATRRNSVPWTAPIAPRKSIDAKIGNREEFLCTSPTALTNVMNMKSLESGGW